MLLITTPLLLILWRLKMIRSLLELRYLWPFSLFYYYIYFNFLIRSFDFRMMPYFTAKDSKEKKPLWVKRDWKPPRHKKKPLWRWQRGIPSSGQGCRHCRWWGEKGCRLARKRACPYPNHHHLGVDPGECSSLSACPRKGPRGLIWWWWWWRCWFWWYKCLWQDHFR